MDGIIFDIDGTIWDSRQPVAESWEIVMKKETDLNPHYTADDMTPLFGKTTVEIAHLLLDGTGLTEEEMLKLMVKATKYESEYLATHPGTLYPGVREMIERLSEKYPLYIVSNCDFGYIEVMLDTMKLNPYFKDHLCFADTGLSKGENMRIMADRNGLKSPIYIGDTQGDLNACRSAGIPMIHVTYGLGTADAPDFVADSPEDVCKILL